MSITERSAARPGRSDLSRGQTPLQAALLAVRAMDETEQEALADVLRLRSVRRLWHVPHRRSNRLALGWVDEALRLERENGELRCIATTLLFFLAEREWLAEDARTLIVDRFPDEGRLAD